MLQDSWPNGRKFREQESLITQYNNSPKHKIFLSMVGIAKITAISSTDATDERIKYRLYLHYHKDKELNHNE